MNLYANLVKLPNMVGRYYEEVRDYEGLAIEIMSYQYNDEVEKGRIIDQTPAYSEGAEVAEGTVIKVTVSQGPEPEVKVMENLVNQSYETAKKFLEDQGMHVLQGEEFSDDVEEGRVVRTDPAVGTELKDGQTVWVYVSKGPVIEKQKMLNVVGLKYSIAYNQLIGQGFESIDQ